MNLENNMDPYEVLGISSDASEKEIKTAYRRKARQYHPDLKGADSTSKMQEVNNAYTEIKERLASLKESPVAGMNDTGQKEPVEQPQSPRTQSYRSAESQRRYGEQTARGERKAAEREERQREHDVDNERKAAERDERQRGHDVDNERKAAERDERQRQHDLENVRKAAERDERQRQHNQSSFVQNEFFKLNQKYRSAFAIDGMPDTVSGMSPNYIFIDHIKEVLVKMGSESLNKTIGSAIELGADKSTYEYISKMVEFLMYLYMNRSELTPKGRLNESEIVLKVISILNKKMLLSDIALRFEDLKLDLDMPEGKELWLRFMQPEFKKLRLNVIRQMLRDSSIESLIDFLNNSDIYKLNKLTANEFSSEFRSHLQHSEVLLK